MPTLPALDDLRCFEAAAVRLNFRAASSAVGLSPAAFSERIKRLEDRLGVRLFNRTTRRVQLTLEGERLLPQARRTLAEARACLDLGGGPSPFELTLGVGFELGLSWLVPGLETLREERPERRLHLTFGDGQDLVQALDQGHADAVIGSMQPPSPTLEAALLHEGHHLLVSSPELDIESPEDAAALTLVDISPKLPLFQSWRQAQPAEQVWRFGSHEYMGTIGAIKARLLAGAGVAVLPEYFVREALTAGDLVERTPGHRPRSDWLRLLWRPDHPRAGELQCLATSLRALPL
ncbi:MAG TPA: LysR family transcriptional regulator [Myxococcota bacterium]|nr:LysR family transcriptional regulator [Myxococcota bacterium]